MRAQLGFSALTLFCLSLTSTATQADPLCDRVAQTYRACGASFDYNGRDFTFNVGGVRRTVMCSDGRRLGFYDRVNSMDVVSTFLYEYRPGTTPLPEVRLNHDAGRLRVEELLKQIYGHSESAARSHLVRVPFLNQSLLFTDRHGAGAALAAAGRDLLALARGDAQVATFLRRWTSGQESLRGNTFFWRVVSGTPRLSAHSFGSAIDLVTNVGPQYWLWDERASHPDRVRRGEEAYRNIHYIPKAAPIWNMKVVAIMERHGFVWGGKWNHYDAMHFEYRPEFFPGVAINCPARFKGTRALAQAPEAFPRATQDEIEADLQTALSRGHFHED